MLQRLPAFSLLEGRDTSFPSPQTPHPQGSSRDSSKPLGSSIKLLRLRSRGECLWHSFRSLAAYCSSSAHPRNICCVGFARMALLAKYIRMRTARSAATASHPCVEHATEGINLYREQSFRKKKNPAGVTPQGFCQAFLKSVDQAATSERRDSSLSLPSFLSRERKRRGVGHCVSLPSNSPPSRVFP